MDLISNKEMYLLFDEYLLHSHIVQHTDFWAKEESQFLRSALNTALWIYHITEE